jgi:hypothetical protein
MARAMSTYERKIAGFAALLAGVGLALVPTDAVAYSTYSASKVQGQPSGNCVTCHGDFRASPYLRLGMDRGWGTDLMTGHLDVIAECSVCHTSPNYPVSTSSSDGFGGQFLKGCLGCHGRFEASLGTFESSGLRQRHFEAGVTVCAGCHSDDSDPAVVTPDGEDLLPDNYDRNPSVVSLTDPCNPMDMGEDFRGSMAGLDNDGDGLYDAADVIDCPEPGAALLQCAALASLALIARRRSHG